MTFESLSAEVEKSKRRIRSKVLKRLEEFRKNKNLFSEMCFCILTANYTAEGGIRIQREVGDFGRFNQKEMEGLLRKTGHRFPKTRAAYIELAKKHRGKLCVLEQMENSMQRREWLVKNVKGLGYKEASHFLRNIGYFDVAIIDRHILSLLSEHGIIKHPKTITRKRYLEIEKKLRKLAEKTSTSLGELDLYLWHMKTGKILK